MEDYKMEYISYESAYEWSLKRYPDALDPIKEAFEQGLIIEIPHDTSLDIFDSMFMIVEDAEKEIADAGIKAGNVYRANIYTGSIKPGILVTIEKVEYGRICLNYGRYALLKADFDKAFDPTPVESVTVSVEALKDQELTLIPGGHVSTEDEGYFDLKGHAGTFCMDGETCRILSSNADSTTLLNEDGEQPVKFTLTRDEFNLACTATIRAAA